MTPETEAKLSEAKNRLTAAMRAECDRYDLKMDELLALLAYLTGACIAWQDQRKMTPAAALACVTENIQRGNAEAVANLLRAEGGRPC